MASPIIIVSSGTFVPKIYLYVNGTIDTKCIYTHFEGKETQMTDDVEKEKNVRLHIYLPQDEIDAIDDWSFENRIRARTKAIRELVKLGLVASTTKTAD
jgi:hypothetical protein